MVPTTRGHETNREQPHALRWLPFVNRAVVVRSAIVAVVIGSVLTLINQSGWPSFDDRAWPDQQNDRVVDTIYPSVAQRRHFWARRKADAEESVAAAV